MRLIIPRKCDIAHADMAAAKPSVIWPLAFPGDKNAHVWQVTVLDNGKPAGLGSATCRAYFFRQRDGQTPMVVGTVARNVVSAVLPEEVYAYEGFVTGILRLTAADGSQMTLDKITFSVGEDLTGTIIDPGDAIPSIDDLIDQIERLEQANEDADNLVLVQEAQPADRINKIWIRPTERELIFPNWEDHQQLRADMEAGDAELLASRLPRPATSPNGQAGQLLRSLGDGGTEWADAGTPTDAQTATAVAAWLAAHPEATTTVRDGSVAPVKLTPDARAVNVVMADTLAAALALPCAEGRYVRTRGFSTAGDGGGALYLVSTYQPTAMDNCRNFEMQSGLTLMRVFDGGPVTLESLNILSPSVSFETIAAAIEASGAKEVRCGSIETDKSIVIGDWNFTFERIHYTGVEHAIVIDSQQKRFIMGTELYCDNETGGSGLLITSTGGKNCVYNHVDIRSIYASRHCVDIVPAMGKGIMRNTFIFGVLSAWPAIFNVTPIPDIQKDQSGEDTVGLNIEITNEDNGSGGLYYSWEGEDYFEISNIMAYNISPYGSGGSAKAVRIALDTVTEGEGDYEEYFTVCGTITGLTFGHLGVEYSDTGIYMRCGTANSWHYQDRSIEPGIKSILINEMRCRENGRTENFLDVEGWIQDVYIRPTSPVWYPRWSRARNTSMSRMIVDGPVVAGIAGYRSGCAVGHCMVAVDGLTYVRDRMPSDLIVYPDTSESIDDTGMTVTPTDMVDNRGNGVRVEVHCQFGSFPAQAASRGLMMPERFVIHTDLAGTSEEQQLVRLRLEAISANADLTRAVLRGYFYSESACGLRVSVPAYTTVQLQFARGAYWNCEMANTTGLRHQYLVSCYRRNGKRTNSYTITQLD